MMARVSHVVVVEAVEVKYVGKRDFDGQGK
jgi:hypothetical protein